jgi:hypothetical protein
MNHRRDARNLIGRGHCLLANNCTSGQVKFHIAVSNLIWHRAVLVPATPVHGLPLL